MKRIENFRKGDRAEKFGVVLLQAFCAVAEIPRQEDFGLADVVATLLRRDRGYLYAEDSFLVQIKSRTEEEVAFSELKFDAFLCQDVSFLIAQADLTRASIELHSLGIALAHPNINIAKALVAHLHPKENCPFGLVGDTFHLPLRKPILAWSTADIERREFTDKAYEVLKQWLTVERWNRRYRKVGMSRQICWETNAIPTDGGEMYMFNVQKSQHVLEEMAPLVRLLAVHATTQPDLRGPTQNLLAWMREHGVEADPGGNHWLMMHNREHHEELKKALAANPRADLAVAFSIIGTDNDFADFWMFTSERGGQGNGRRHAGSLELLRAKGFAVTMEPGTPGAQVSISLHDSLLETYEVLEVLEGKTSLVTSRQENTGIILLRKKPGKG